MLNDPIDTSKILVGVQRLSYRNRMVIASLNVSSLVLHLNEIKCLIQEQGIHILAINKTKLDSRITEYLIAIRWIFCVCT